MWGSRGLNGMRILALTKYGPLAASTRQRFVQYEPVLADAGFSVDYAPLLNDAHVQRIADGKRASPTSVAAAYVRRVFDVLRADEFDALWVHCELFPYLPGVFERLAFVHGKPVVYDYDDAIFHMYDRQPRSLTGRLLAGKLAALIRGSAIACCGNQYLRDYAERFTDRLIILPTVVDTDSYRPAATPPPGPLTIGWIGSPSTWTFVRPILPLLADLSREWNIRFLAVGAGRIAEADLFDGMALEPWSESAEIAAVQAMDIGIMPLPDEPWARGKCGYKLIQYMACGLPVVASPVGVNAAIVEEGVSGFLAADAVQWKAALTRLIDDAALRAAMGKAGRRRAVGEYSLCAHAPRLVAVMLDAVSATLNVLPRLSSVR